MLIILKFFTVLIACSVLWTLLKKVILYMPTKESRKIHSYLNSIACKNLKSEYLFIDHAIDEYDNELSMISLNEEFKVQRILDEDIDRIANYINKDKVYTAIEKVNKEIQKKKQERMCIGIKFIMHSRDQRKQNDEAHWLRIECMRIRNQTRFVSQELHKELNRINNINQPETINRLTPLVSLGQFYCSLVIPNNKEIGCRYNVDSDSYSPYKIIRIDSLFNTQQSRFYLKDVKNFILHKLNDIKCHIVSIRFTDLGIDGGIVSIFTEIEIAEESKDCLDVEWFDYEKFCNIEREKTSSQLFLIMSKILYN